MRLVASALVIAGLTVVASIAVADVSQAQVVPVTASLDRDTIDFDGTFTLTVTILGETNVPLPTLPTIRGALLIGRRTESTITMLEGKASATFKFVYRFRPLTSGILIIDPITVSMHGITYETQSLSVNVLAGAAQFLGPPPRVSTAEELAGQNYFIEAQVDNDNPYLGQQITYRAQFFAAEFTRGGEIYQPPSFRGFWNGQITRQTVRSTTAAGRRYRLTEYRTVLFPTLLGETVIEPASIRPRGLASLQRTRYTTAQTLIDVRPLPAGAPPSFTGAVGNFSISARVDIDETATGDPITMTVEISGEGNLATQADPDFPDMPGWRVFESKTDTDLSVVNGTVQGTRTYERILVPNSPGRFILPAIVFSFFDPKGEQYRTVETDSIPVRVSPSAALVPLESRAPATQGEAVRTASDIRHIRPVPDRLSLRRDRITSSLRYWAAWLLPVVGVAAGIAWRYRVRLSPGLGRATRSVSAIENALAATRSARASGADPFPAAGRALTDYLAVRLGRPSSSLTRQTIADTLSRRGVGAVLAADIEAILTLIEGARYGPGAATGSAADLLDDTERLIEELERELGR